MVSALKHLQNYLQICFPHPDFFRTFVLKILSSLKSQMTRRRLQRGWAQDGRRVQCSVSLKSSENFSSTRGQHSSTFKSNLSFRNEKSKTSIAKESQSICLLYTPQILFLKGACIFLTETQGFTSNAVLSFSCTVSSTILLYSQ